MNIRQGNREIKRDFRSNTASGEPKHCGPSKELGARLVSQRIGREPRNEYNANAQLAAGVGRGVKFAFGENRAKKIDQDAEPR